MVVIERPEKWKWGAPTVEQKKLDLLVGYHKIGYPN